MEEEVWKELEEFKGFYVSNKGRIKNDKKILKTGTSPRGYRIAVMWIDGKLIGRNLHVLLAKTFIINPDPDKKTQVNHIDGDKLNNDLNNLEWVTPSENMLHSIHVLGNHPEKWAGKQIVCVDFSGEIKVFKTLSFAAKYICEIENYKNHKQAYVNISKAINKRNGISFGRYWYYSENFDENNIKEFKKMRTITKLRDCQAIFILKKYVPHDIKFSGKKLAKMFRINPETLSSLIHNKNYKHIDRSQIDNPHITK